MLSDTEMNVVYVEDDDHLILRNHISFKIGCMYNVKR